MEVDSLVVSLGLDSQDFRAALNQVLAMLHNLDQGLRDFAQGFAEGCEDALNEARQSANGAAREVGQAAREGQRMGQAFRQAGETGSQGVNRLADTTGRAAQRARDAGNSMQNLGRQWGSFLQGIVTRFAAPMAGALSVGAMVGSYLSGVSQAAQMYGRWTPQMEEWRKKQELLSRVNREDIELYRKGKLALMDFQFAMAGLSTTIMRALSPAIRAGIELLHQVADWVRRNEPNIIRFVTVLAGTITAVLLPAFIKLGVAMLANPLTWIIAGIVALAIAVDDLVVYIRGGESAFGDFWSQFGSGEEILQNLTEKWETFKDVFQRFLPLFPSIAAGFATFGMLKGATGAINAAATAFKVFNTVLKANPIIFILSLVMAVVPLIIQHWDEIKEAFNAVGDAIRKKWEEVMGWIGEKLAWFEKKWKGIKEFFGFGDEEDNSASTPPQKSLAIDPKEKHLTGLVDPLGLGTGIVPSNSDLTFAAVPPSVSTSNRNTEISSQTHINQLNMYTQATDAEGIVRDIQGELDRNPLIPGVNAADGGVY